MPGRAVEALPTPPAHILVDGKRRIAGGRISQTAVVGGDALSASIAAASIVAKVTRDSLMEKYAELYPEYSFERHKGMAPQSFVGARYRGVRQALFQNACRHAVAAVVHRLAEFSEESRDQPRSLNALSSFMKRCVRPFTPYWRVCDHDCGVARGTSFASRIEAVVIQ